MRASRSRRCRRRTPDRSAAGASTGSRPFVDASYGARAKLPATEGVPVEGVATSKMSPETTVAEPFPVFVPDLWPAGIVQVRLVLTRLTLTVKVSSGAVIELM